MKNLINTISAAAFAVNMGCNTPDPDTYITKEGDVIVMEAGDTCPVSADTLPIQHSWAVAKAVRRACGDDASDNLSTCIEDGNNPTVCNQVADFERDECAYWEAREANKLPARVCGVTMFDIDGDIGADNFSVTPTLDDWDGDGIANWWEYRMGYNPCTVNSFYSVECTEDGDLDWDGDGIVNGEDDQPICHYNPDNEVQDDPGDYIYDCV